MGGNAYLPSSIKLIKDQKSQAQMCLAIPHCYYHLKMGWVKSSNIFKKNEFFV